jgi:hypothetical protein
MFHVQSKEAGELFLKKDHEMKDTEKQILINKIFSLLHCMYKISSDIQLANCYHVNLNNQSGETTLPQE